MIPGFVEICEGMIATHKAKNADYGSSWHLYEQLLGVTPSVGLMTRILDKVSRACNLMRKGEENRSVADEALDDTLMDLAVYSIMTLLTVREERARGEIPALKSIELTLEPLPFDPYEKGQRVVGEISTEVETPNHNLVQIVQP